MKLLASTQVVRIPELLHLIIGELRQNPQSLARLGRVSTTFYDVVIQYLWLWEDPQWTPARPLSRLLRFLPPVVLEMVNLGTFKGTSEDADWDRFRLYAAHTRSLAISTKDHPPALFSFLVNQNPPLFPHLQTLTVAVTPSSPTEWIALVGLNIDRLELTGVDLDDPDGCIPFFQHLATRAPDMRQLFMTNFPLSCSTPGLSVKLEEAVCHTLHSLRYLHTFHCHSPCAIAPRILATIIGKWSISDLVLAPLETWPSPAEGNFPFQSSLRHMKLESKAAAGARCIQSIAHPQKLSSLNVVLTDTGEGSPPFRFLSVIKNLFYSLKYISTLHLDFRGLPILWEPFEPLLCCKYLDDVHITSLSPIVGFNDSAVEDLARSWQFLKQLTILSGCYQDECQVTLLALKHFAQFAPSLRELSIRLTSHVKARSAKTFRDFQPIKSSPFRLLRLYDSEINAVDIDGTFRGPCYTAKFLKTVWPSLPSAGLEHRWRTAASELQVESAWSAVGRQLAGKETERV